LGKGDYLTQEDLLKIRLELSGELDKMSPSQRRNYLEAAKDVYRALSIMLKIRETVVR
jgi:hypothetical protein